MSNQDVIKWLSEPEEKNYPAAESYLTLLHAVGEVTALVRSLRKAKVCQFKAKDIFRASGLSLLESVTLAWKRTNRRSRTVLRYLRFFW